MTKVHCIIVALFLVVASASVIDAASKSSTAAKSYYKFSTSATYHSDYGLSYPVTYEFSIPSGSSNLKAYKKYTTSGAWSQITEKTSSDLFNGIEAVRFDYKNKKAYVSVAFGPNSNDIYLKIVNSKDNQVGTYQKIDTYYDNRQAAVAVTADDWNGQTQLPDDYYNNFIDAFRSRHIWVTCAIMTNYNGIPANWAVIQSNLDKGYVEPASHSRLHQDIPYDNYDSEISGSKSDIINYLSLPALNTRGSQEYVYAWIGPYGSSNSKIRAKLGQSKYLADRSTVVGNSSYAQWDTKNRLYKMVGPTIEADDHNTSDWAPPFPGTATLNSKFDSVVAARGIYVIYFHPMSVQLSDLIPHLDYIKDKTNIWYAGFGHLYEYNFIRERGITKITTV